MRFHPDVLAAHAQFGGDLEDMQRKYDAASLAASLPQDVERVVRFDHGRYGMRELPNGGYVLFSDYRALSSQLAEARAREKAKDDQYWSVAEQCANLEVENEAFRAALEGIAAPAIFFLSREDAVKMRNQARAALASLEERG